MTIAGPGALTVREAPAPRDVEADVDAFLNDLPGPTILRRPGRDRRRARVVSGTLHGNEPSGLRAIHAALREDEPPAVDTLFFVGGVEAARARPRYAHRMLPGRRDLNRCFRPPFAGPDGAVAEAALRVLRAARPEAVVDLHNNTGLNPAYGVSRHLDGAHLQLVSLFATRVVHSELELGTLTEAFDGEALSVTVECGQAGTLEADAVAAAGLRRFIQLDRVEPVFVPADDMVVLHAPVRVCLRPPATLAFAAGPVPSRTLTLDAEIDRHNFESVAPETRLGWIAPGAPWPLEAIDRTGADVSPALFHQRGGELLTRGSMVPIMMTTNVAAALADCLFYAARRRH